MPEHERCPRCGADVDVTQSCAACLHSAAIDSSEPPDLTGEWVGRYVIGRLLGKGAMGVVYEAFDTVLERTVALKILADDLDAPELSRTMALKIRSDDLDASERLVREAQLAAALEHEHIVPVYEVGEHHGLAYFTMKRVDGGPLKTPAPGARRAAEIALSIAKAVAYAHQHGILHRDLKPANVLVDKKGQPFVSDFGLAAREGLAILHGGTPLYMAPEVWRREPGAASTRADVWSAGVILYELLTGHPPFEASAEQELMRFVTEEPPPPLSGVHPDLAAICLHCLEKDPSRRGTAVDLVADLESFLAGEPVRANPLGRGARWLRRARRHPVIALLSTLLCVAALYTVVTKLSLARAQATTLHTADFAARRVADLTALQFDRFKAAVEAAGRDPRVVRALTDPTSPKASEVCAWLLAERVVPTGGPFATWFLLDADGKLIGRAPEGPHDVMGRSFEFRDYYRGAKEIEEQGGRTAYVSRAYRSESHDDHQIAIAFAVHDDAKRWIGLLSATIPTGSALGSVELDDPGDKELTASLLAPRGLERGERAPDPEPIFILHRSLRRGEALPVHGANVLDANDGAGALIRLVPVRGTPFSVLVSVAFDGAR